ncbi:MAG: hypothetical protein SGBAC_008560 [Bacillariaceae sp.]
MTSSNDDPLCFPVLDLFRRVASAGGLVVRQEHDQMMALAHRSPKSDLSNWGTSTEMNADEIACRDLVGNTLHTGNIDNAINGTIHTTGSSSSSAASETTPPPPPPSMAPKEATPSSPAEASIISQAADAEVFAGAYASPTTTQQEQVTPKVSYMKRNGHKPSLVYGLEIIVESDLEELEDEVEEGNEEAAEGASQNAAKEGAPVNQHISAIRWSDQENNDPNALNVTVHEVECIKDRTDMWWQTTEFVSIKQGVSEAIRFCKAYNRNHVELLEDIMRCDCLEDEDLMTDLLKDLLSTCDSKASSESFLRGLEGHLSKVINKYRKRHSRKVLSAQEGLRDDDNNTLEESWELLREESLDKSQPLSAFARRMGQFDEMVVAKSQKTRTSLWGV